MDKFTGIYPDYFPSDFDEILPKGAGCCIREVYRVGKYGENNREAFIGTYGEVLCGTLPKRNREKWLENNKRNIDSLSTSFFETFEDIKHLCDVTLKELPEKVILKGVLQPEDGPSQLTRERKPCKTDSHVDGWLYKNASPEKHFYIVNEGE